MRSRFALLTLITSILLLAGVAVMWQSSASAPPRADLTSGASTAGAGPAPTPTSPSTSPAPLAGDGPADASSARRFRAVAVAAPTRLVIPSIGVDVAVRPVGVLPDGGMEVPSATEAGWFSPGPHPTAPFGSAVLAAHIDHGGRPGAFFRLRELAVGEQVIVRLADGSDHAYRVTERMQVPKEDLPTDEVFRRTGPPILTLVTCGGAFDRSARHYRDNIIVRAVPV